MNLAPLVLFVYNRLDHTTQTIKALQKNKLADESELFIYSDAAKHEADAKKVDEIRKYINSIKGFKKINIILREDNFGLAKSIIDGVTDIVNRYGKIIVLEDDLVTSPFFLQFMNNALDTYEKNTDIASVSAYMFPVSFPKNEFYFLPFISSWGWATWKDSWKLFEKDGKKLLNEIKQENRLQAFNLDNSYPYTKMLKNQIKGKNNSWAIRWNASLFINQKLSLWPSTSLVENIGFDGSGTHCNINYYSEEKKNLNEKILLYDKKILVSKEAYTTIKKHLIDKGLSQLSIRKIMLKLISIFKK